ncbi:MAG TPA: long-chain fatty acid--CoA ligase [Thermomicrobiaceae bacterium]|nr:long-chain fatty acid--CoA ligase [Thermomicrobiaceae bacterium]
MTRPDPSLDPAEDRPWYRWYEPGVPRTLSYPEQPLPRFLADTTARHPDRTAIRFMGRGVSYRDLDEAANRFANALIALGVRPGDRVALLLPNCPQIVIGYYGAQRAGAIVVPINPTYVASELRELLADAEPRVVIALSLLFPRVQQIRADLPSVEHVVVTNIKEYFPAVTQALFTVARERREGHHVHLPADGHTHEWHALLAGAPASEPESAMTIDDVAVLQYTSGTTGTPKGVMLTHRNLIAAARQAQVWCIGIARPGNADVVLGVIPIFHIFGQDNVLNYPIFGGGTMVLLPQFAVKDTLAALDRERPDIFPGVPALFAVLGRARDVGRYDLRSLKASICGAAPLSDEVRARFEALSGAPIAEGYGSTEALITHCAPLKGRHKPGTIGIPIPETDAAILDLETGSRRLGPGEPGELAVRGPQVMRGYWRRRDETARAFRDGWLLTGDVAVMDADGYFTLIDRRKELINVGGLKVFPSQVEAVIAGHPAVGEVVTVGVPDPRHGEVVKAFVVLREGMTATAEEIIGHCRERLAPYKLPRSVEFRPNLPKNLFGKVLRRTLLEEERARRENPAAS